MKTFIPRHIQGGWFNMSLQIGPLTVTIVQLLILAAGLALSLAIWNGLTNQGVDKFITFILVLPVFTLFVVIAFFKYSELKLIPFLAKVVRTYFLDETKKYQVNYRKIDPIEVRKKILKTSEKKEKIKIKKGSFDKKNLEKLKGFTDN